ncbi:unnamed protein product [Amaranthus hypochondriacus]
MDFSTLNFNTQLAWIWISINIESEYEILKSISDNEQHFISVMKGEAQGSCANCCKNSEREALLKIKHIFRDTKNVDFLESWVGEDCCAWKGVGCNNVTGNIIHFKLTGDFTTVHSFVRDIDYPLPQSMSGGIIAALQEVKHLTYLELSGLDLHKGSIPPLIASMTHLRYLNLSNANFIEDVPDQLGNLTALEVLDLSNNDLDIASLEWVSSLSNLKFINLSSNKLPKALDLDKLPDVFHLSVSQCRIYHFSVTNSSNHASLKYLDISHNMLVSPLTPNLVNLSSLVFLDLSYNLFNGSVPHYIKNLDSLQTLSVGANNFDVKGGIWELMRNSCRFKHLDLSDNNIQGDILQLGVNISKCIGYELEFLDISNNKISGTLSPFLGQFKRLKYLDISSNPIQGKFSEKDIGDLSELSYIDISNTNLSLNLASDWLPPFQLRTLMIRSCKIINPPNWLQTQASLEELDVSNNGMSGEPANWISKMSNLHGLILSNNLLIGPLPQQFSSQNLKFLDIHNNSLSGTIPNWLGDLNNLEFVDLSSNHFSGYIPQNFRKSCRLKTLLLTNNSLEGIIPPSLGNCRSLMNLDLGDNNLSGNIPPWTNDDLPMLIILKLQRNQLGKVKPKNKSGVFGNETISMIPESLCNITMLTILDLQKNKLSGTIPDCLSPRLEMINFSSNKLSGVIPCPLSNLSSLAYLHLNDNELQGEIPSCLSFLSGMKILDFGENKLSGLVPSWLNRENFPKLKVLRLSKNLLNGTIPHELCSLSLLRVLDLSSNYLTGNIIPCFGNLIGINKHLKTITDDDLFDFSDLDFDYLIPIQYGFDNVRSTELTHENSVNETIAGIERDYSTLLALFTAIDISGNRLEGSIPEELIKLSGLIALNLAGNHLTGNIPEKIGDMKALETLDLSRNYLCGRIPPSLGNIDSLNHINFSFNNLSGPIPTNRHFETLEDPSVYEGNPYLCGDNLPRKCLSHVEPPTTQVNQDEEDEVDKNENLWFYLVVMSGVAIGFWSVVGTLWVNKRCRHALFSRVDDFYDWLYVGIAMKKSKIKKWMNKDNSQE